MKILLVVAYFVPEIASAAHVYFDLGRAFIKRGHKVDVITSYSRSFNLIKEDADKEFSLEETIEASTLSNGIILF
jgi:colanic acid biosynthesis glycosyl transferase WcaI